MQTQARTLCDFTVAGTRFVTKAAPTRTKAHGPHIRLEHRLDGRVVTQQAWLDAHREADPVAHRAAYGSDDE
jgi:hypothetical protein